MRDFWIWTKWVHEYAFCINCNLLEWVKGLDLDGKIGWMSDGRIETVECDCFFYKYLSIWIQCGLCISLFNLALSVFITFSLWIEDLRIIVFVDTQNIG